MFAWREYELMCISGMLWGGCWVELEWRNDAALHATLFLASICAEDLLMSCLSCLLMDVKCVLVGKVIAVCPRAARVTAEPRPTLSHKIRQGDSVD